MGLLSFEDVEFEYEPYPIGVAHKVLPAEYYDRLVATFPPRESFVYKESLGRKYSLSEVNDPDAYHRFLGSNPDWRRFYEEVKDPAFIRQVVSMLERHRLDLGLADSRILNINRLSPFHRVLEGLSVTWSRRVRHYSSLLKLLACKTGALSVRFEFSMLPVDGGHILPHTDAPQKLITLVIPVLKAGEWDPVCGGATDVLRPKDRRENFNQLNRYLRFEDVEVLRSIPYEPNQCAVFIKTFNSLHSVAPMTGRGSDVMRKTLTINIEKIG